MILNIQPENVIENSNGELKSVSGPEAMAAFRLRTILVGLKFEAQTGMRMTRGMSCRTLAKQETGLKTNNVEKLTQALAARLDAQIGKCLVVTDGE